MSGSTIDNGGDLLTNPGSICNQMNVYNSKHPEYSESLGNIRGDEYLDPITGEFTTNDTIGGIYSGAIPAESTTLQLTNEVYNKNQILDSLPANVDISRSNDNYGKILNNYDNSFHYKIAQPPNFSTTGIYPQLNVSTISSSASSSLSSSSNNAMINMTSF